MMHKTVYLAGPILGTDKNEANNWRHHVAARLEPEKIIGISPLRCEPLIGERYTANYPDPKFGTARAIASKNLFDVRTCDLIFVYLPTPPPNRHQSFGTIVELAWAYAIGKPVILVSDDPRVLEHPVINVCCGWVLPTLEDGIEVALGILAGYTGGKNI